MLGPGPTLRSAAVPGRSKRVLRWRLVSAACFCQGMLASALQGTLAPACAHVQSISLDRIRAQVMQSFTLLATTCFGLPQILNKPRAGSCMFCHLPLPASIRKKSSGICTLWLLPKLRSWVALKGNGRCLHWILACCSYGFACGAVVAPESATGAKGETQPYMKVL